MTKEEKKEVVSKFLKCSEARHLQCVDDAYMEIHYGKYGYGAPMDALDDDSYKLSLAVAKFNEQNKGFKANKVKGDKYITITIVQS